MKPQLYENSLDTNRCENGQNRQENKWRKDNRYSLFLLRNFGSNDAISATSEATLRSPKINCIVAASPTKTRKLKVRINSISRLANIPWHRSY